ncbi:MAG: ferrous iron transport protein A [Burkholderiaceae bacterium]|nr:ferrous iron transport protein A [Burkholderiaceae bacterium]
MNSNADLSVLRLDQLASHAPAMVIDVAWPDDEQGRHLALRLSEIGFVPGQTVRIVTTGMPGREPLAVRLGRSTFALRKREAALVHVALEGAALVRAARENADLLHSTPKGAAPAGITRKAPAHV